MGTCNDLVVLAVPFDLGGARSEVGEFQGGLTGAQIVDEDKAVDSTCG